MNWISYGWRNQKQIIEQTKFTYSPFRKAIEKQIKTIEIKNQDRDQGEKQIKAIQNQEKIKTIKKYAHNDEDNPLISNKKKYLINLQMKDLKK